MDLLYILDIHSTDGVYIEKADISIAAKKFKRGRNPSLPKDDTIRTKACDIVKGLREEECKTYTVRDAAKGPLVIDVGVQEIYSWDQQDRDCRKELLVVGGSKNEKGV